MVWCGMFSVLSVPRGCGHAAADQEGVVVWNRGYCC